MSYSSLSEFQLPLPKVNFPPLLQQNSEQTPVQLRQLAKKSIKNFNLDQKQIVNEVIYSVLLGVSANGLDVQPTTNK